MGDKRWPAIAFREPVHSSDGSRYVAPRLLCWSHPHFIKIITEKKFYVQLIC